MSSHKESVKFHLGHGERGRSMRISGKGFLTGLGLLLTILPMMAAFAATNVTGIDHSSTEDGGVKITLQISGDVPQVSVFATQSPTRIVLDLADTQSEAGTDAVTVGLGPVQQYSAIAAGGRTRLIVDLSHLAAYDYNADSGQVVLTIAGGGVTASSTTSVGGSGFSLTGVDFRRGEEAL
jgi:type IV pilus assembly protein PilQ